MDYVRMLRATKGVDWSKHLTPVDLPHLVQRVEPDAWYSMETFEHMGLAILAEVAHGDLETVRAFGRGSIDWLCQTHPDLVAVGDPRDSLMRFQVLRRSFFNYAALCLDSVSDGEASITIGYGMSDAAEEAAAWQTLGFFERLLEVAGASDAQAWFSSRAWKSELVTEAQLRWSSPPPST